MTDVAIRVENLSKRYTIGALKPSYETLRDQLAESLKSLFHRDGQPGKDVNEIWALKDVSLEIKRGEALGVIGRNGAGKSTMLKILSRITEPTEGRARISGRVGSLLEVGTGFHPELTGRENIYLNGAILGMRRREINRKFDEIVDFAGTHSFVDTPVKYYSSGMYVRLAFAVAAHLEPEILLVDEVLAVGDAAFQKKCLGKMSEVAHEGRTVLFVSHNLAAVQSLCETCCLLDGGQLIESGPTRQIVRNYLKSVVSQAPVPLDQRQDRSGNGSLRTVSLRIESADGDGVIRPTSRLRISLGYQSPTPLRQARFTISVSDYASAGIFLLDSDAVGSLPQALPAQGTVNCVTDPINLTPGRCYVNVALYKAGTMADYVQYAAEFDVEPDVVYGFAQTPPRSWVLCILPHVWSFYEDGR